jgi:hypothetical protein
MNKSDFKTIIIPSVLSIVLFLYILFIFAPAEILSIASHQALASSTSTINGDVDLNRTNSTVSNFLTYVNPTFDFKIDYPSDWSYQQYDIDPLSNETIHTLVDITPPISEDPNVVTNFYVGIEEFQDLPSLDNYARNGISAYRSSNQNFSLVSVAIANNSSNANLTLSGKPSYQIVFTDFANGIQRKSIDRGILDEHNKRSYWLIFNTEISKYDKLLPVVQRMIQSFEFNNVTIPNQRNTTEGFKDNGDTPVNSSNSMDNSVSSQFPGFEQQNQNDVSSSNLTVQSESFLEYSNPFGFNISYPVGSEVKEDQNIVFIFIPGVANAHAGALVDINMQLDQYIKDEISHRNNTFPDFSFIKSEDVNFYGYPGRSIEHEFTLNGKRFLDKEFYTIVDNVAYNFGFDTEAENFENVTSVMNRMLDSFEITQPSGVRSQIPQESQGISTLTFLPYRHPTLGFEIEYPEAPGLDVEELEEGVGFPHSQGGYTVFVARDISSSLEGFAVGVRIGDLQHFKLLGETKATVAGHPAIRTEYTHTLDNGVPIHAIDYSVLFGSDGYRLSFSRANPTEGTLNEFLAVVQRMLDSFQFPQNDSSGNVGDLQEQSIPGTEGFGSGSSGSGQDNDQFDPFGPQSPSKQNEGEGFGEDRSSQSP